MSKTVLVRADPAAHGIPSNEGVSPFVISRRWRRRIQNPLDSVHLSGFRISLRSSGMMAVKSRHSRERGYEGMEFATYSTYSMKRGDLYRALAPLMMIIFVMTVLAGCGPKEGQGRAKTQENITVAVTLWPASAPIYVSQEQGYFKDEALNVILQNNLSGHLGLDAVLSGKADLATAGETPIARAAMHGKPLSVIATICEIDRAILIIGRKDRGISAPQDLKGMSIGVVAGTTADFFLHIYLITSYIDPKDVRIVHLATDRVVDALLEGGVDAVSTWAPHTIVLRDKLGGNAMVLQDPSIYTMTWNIVATPDFVKKHPEPIRRFLGALIRANQFISEQPAETRAICSRHIGEDNALFDREWSDYRFIVALDQSLILNLEDQARWMFEGEGAAGRRLPNFMEFVHAAELKAIRPEAVKITGK